MQHVIKLLVLIFFFGACNAAKKAKTTVTDTNLQAKTAATLLNKMANNRLEAEWLDAKARITFQDEAQTRKFTATIRLRKDSVIWMNVKKASVEFARILIDQDSVYILNRLDKEYYVRGVDYVEQEFNLPANFDALQNMILGNPYLFDDQSYQSTTSDTQYRLSGGEGSNMLNDYWLNKESFLLEQMSFLDLRNDRKVVAGMSDYQPLDTTTVFSFHRDFQLNSEQTGEVFVTVKFLKVVKDIPKKLPFAVSSRYKRVD